MLHYAINTNSYNLHLLIWKESLPIWFATIRYIMLAMGLSGILGGYSSRGQRRNRREGTFREKQHSWPWPAVDMAGEQSYMKSSKTAGGMCQFSTNEAAVAKWVMNRPFQAKFAETLMEISGLSKTTLSSRKCLRPSEILKSEKMVKNILDPLQIQFLNPFHQDIEKSNLYNLVSGRPVDDAICDKKKSLLGLGKNGIGLIESFEERLTTDPTTATSFSLLKRNKYKSWKESTKKIVIKKDGKVKELTFQRGILGILVAHSYQYNSGIDIDSVLCYPLAPVSVPLSTTDGSIRKTIKSKLFKAAMSDLSVVMDEDLPGPDKLRTYFLDLAAAVRTIVGKTTTVRELAARILVMVPCQYKDIYIACHAYEENSIKGGERVARGTSERYFLRSPDMKVPHDFCRLSS